MDELYLLNVYFEQSNVTLLELKWIMKFNNNGLSYNFMQSNTCL
jgi:hypothetical protein